MRPAYVPHPCELIAELIAERGWTQTKLAGLMGRPHQLVNEIIHGKREITPETALQLAAAFGSSDRYFMNMETSYRLWFAGQKEASRLDAIRERVRVEESATKKAR